MCIRDRPHTVLFGEGSTGTLGAAGESEQNTLNVLIGGVQNKELRKQAVMLLRLILSQKEFNFASDQLPLVDVEFNPLDEPTEKQMVDIRKVQSEVDNAYYQMGVLTSEEIADSRFKNGWSLETTLDQETREMQAELPDVVEEDKDTDEDNGENQE